MVLYIKSQNSFWNILIDLALINKYIGLLSFLIFYIVALEM